MHTGGKRAGHTGACERARRKQAMEARIAQRAPTGMCAACRAAGHAYLLDRLVTFWSCTWLRARMTCNADDGRKRRAPDSVSAKGERGCVRTGASRCVADPQHVAPSLFRSSGPTAIGKRSQGKGDRSLCAFKKATRYKSNTRCVQPRRTRERPSAQSMEDRVVNPSRSTC